MEVKINVPDHIIAAIENRFMEYANRAMTKQELIRFLQNDIIEVYTQEFSDGIDDAVMHVA